VVAIVAGVAFFAAAGFLGDRVIDSLEGETRNAFGAVDVAVIGQLDDEFAFEELPRIPGDLAEEIAALDTVDASAFVLIGDMSLRTQDGDIVAAGARGRLWISDDDVNPIGVEEGRGPTERDEIAIDRGIAADHDLGVGDEVTSLSVAGDDPVTIVGITKFGDDDSFDGVGTISVAPVAADRLSSRDEFDEVYLRTSDSESELLDEVAALLPEGLVAQSGDEFLADKIQVISLLGGILKTALRAFAVLAMLVGGFVIYNTFSVLLAQRIRELAVLRAIAATPAQVRSALLFEGAVVGAVASVLGTVVGAGLVSVFAAILERFGVGLPGSGIVLRRNAVLLPIVFGTIITVGSVWIPARSAAGIKPIEALRTAAVERVRPMRRRVGVTAILSVVSLALLFISSNTLLIFLGVIGVFAATVAAGPVIAASAAAAVRPLSSRLSLPAQLATDNAGRNPNRTATTANALLIGVFLVTLVSVAGASVRDYAVAEIGRVEASDYTLITNSGVLDDQLVEAVRSVDGVETAETFRRETAPLDGRPIAVSTVDVAALSDFTDLATSDAELADVPIGSAFVGTDLDLTVGDTFRLDDPRGGPIDLEVAAILDSGQDADAVSVMIHPDDFDTLFGPTEPTAAFVEVVASTADETGDALDAVLERRPDVAIASGNSLGQSIGSAIDLAINGVNALLLMSVFVAVIGIVNTLTLSIFERRRELGLLRAVGMLDRDVRLMVRLESVFVAMLGTVTGVILGGFCGWALLQALRRWTQLDIGVNWAIGRLGVVVALGLLLGYMASVLPARRSTRLDVLDAIEAP